MHFPSKHEFSWEVRKSAIDTLSDDFFALLTEDKKSLLGSLKSLLGGGR